VIHARKEKKQMSTTSRRRMKFQAVTDKCQVEIVDLKGSYIRTAGTKWAAILDGAELCRVEEFAARHFSLSRNIASDPERRGRRDLEPPARNTHQTAR
jgi:hypothetical protein